MKEAINRIRKLRSEGRLSESEAEELLSALGEPRSDAPGEGRVTASLGGQDARAADSAPRPAGRASVHSASEPAREPAGETAGYAAADSASHSASHSASQSASHTAGAAPNDELHGHRRTAGPGTQHGAREAWSELGDELRDTFKAAFKVGAEAWRESRRAAAATGANAAAADGSAAAAAAGMARFARRGYGKSKEWSTGWLNDSNRVVMSSVVVPEGDQYTCTDNEISVSALSRLLFKVAEFNGNRLRAASISGLTLEEGIFRTQQVNGSSLHRLEVRRGMLRDNQFNGSSVARLTLQAGQFADSVCNGAHLRDVEIVDSALSGLRITGGDLRDIAVLAGSRIDQLQITAATVHGLRCEASVLEHLTLRFVKVRGLVVRDSRLTNVRLHNGERTRLGSGAVRGLQLLNSKLTDVEFVDCSFDGACIRDCDVHGLTFAGVDFGSRDIVGNRMLEEFVTAPARRHG